MKRGLKYLEENIITNFTLEYLKTREMDKFYKNLNS